MRRQAPYFFIERGLIHQPPDAVGGGEQADNGGHKGALYEASGVLVCAPLNYPVTQDEDEY